ncbi:DUF3817 domain-containing protein [Nonlabens sp.]|uniref:DUF3817 domain-containing protein n=1 Tax=Nonlabens sp. TaxID=1888209 RepID=UPI003F6A40C5
MNTLFKYLAIIEGYSFLLILFITMPLKYIAGMGMPNKIIGMAHGVLFLSYIVVAIIIAQEKKWNFKDTFIVMIMSVVPFGTFWMEEEYLMEEKATS